MGHRKNFYLSDLANEFISTLPNQSAFVDELIIQSNMSKTGCLKKREDLLKERKTLQVRIADIDLELKSVEAKLRELEELERYRPDGYDEAVDTLLNLKGGIRRSDLQFQADGLGVGLDVLKRWLFDDGVYDDLLMMD